MTIKFLKYGIIFSTCALLNLVTSAFADTQANLDAQVAQLSTKVRQMDNQISYLMGQLQKYDEYQSSIDALRNQIEMNAHQSQETNQKLAELSKDYNQKIDKLQGELDSVKKIQNQKAQDPQDVEFDAAYDLLLKKQYKNAILGFQNYIKRYGIPGKHYSESMYYLGLLYLTEGKISEAKNEFKQIADRFPKSVKYADSLTQLGAIYRVEGNTKLARFYLDKVVKNYPNTQAAKLAQAELKKIK